MTPIGTTAFRVILGATVAAVAVVTPIEILILPLVVWLLLARRWARAGVAGWGPPWAVSILIVLAAAYAPVKSTDRLMDRRMTVPKLAMTLAELDDPLRFGLERPSLGYRLAPPEGLDGQVVRFGSLNPTVREFIAAIESQTPLRHRIYGCGNGWTILWGLETSGVSFRQREPPRLRSNGDRVARVRRTRGSVPGLRRDPAPVHGFTEPVPPKRSSIAARRRPAASTAPGGGFPRTS